MNKPALCALWAGIGFAAACLLFLLLMLLVRPQPAGAQPPDSVPESAVSSDPASAAQTGYLLRELDGRIALYVLPSDQPETVYEIYVDLLPETDIARLRQGIRLDTREEAEAYLADFDS